MPASVRPGAVTTQPRIRAHRAQAVEGRIHKHVDELRCRNRETCGASSPPWTGSSAARGCAKANFWRASCSMRSKTEIIEKHGCLDADFFADESPVASQVTSGPISKGSKFS